jgi:hypothetical protein
MVYRSIRLPICPRAIKLPLLFRFGPICRDRDHPAVKAGKSKFACGQWMKTHGRKVSCVVWAEH